MNYVCELLKAHVERHPERAFLFDEQTPAGLSFARIWELSGRVASWLRERGVGRGDLVLICLPRGVRPIVATFGIWRAGAAYALVEDTYAPERIAFIRRDCGCKVELDATGWEAAMRCQPAGDFVDVDEHDAAYAVFTSGSTGNPKGVLHEYGNLREGVESMRLYEGRPWLPGDARYALIAPLNFVASVIIILRMLGLEEGQLLVLSYATVKNPPALARLIADWRVTAIFLPPSYLRTVSDDLPSCLTHVDIGGEPARGVDPRGRIVYNAYGMSESGFAVSAHRLDSPETDAPIGRPQFANRIVLRDEAGREVAEGETGELWYEDRFVRGYINLPDETARVFRDGFCRSGDLAKRLPSGDIVLMGRNTEMVKINGNRVEPGEIETAVRAALDIDWCAVRPFEDGSRTFLAAYYVADIPEPDSQRLRDRLSQRLPYYMLPQYFVKIGAVPLLANGKLDRRALPKPNAADYAGKYVAPRTDVERALCEAMAKALKVDRIGVNDDFYECGGDSLAAVAAVVGSELPGLSVGEVFRGRTAAKIAEIYAARRAGSEDADSAASDERERRRAHPLTAEQTYMVDYQFYTPHSTMYNLVMTLRLDHGSYDAQKLAAAISAAVAAHPALATTLEFDEDSQLVQRYRPDLLVPVAVERVTEAEFSALKDTLVRPYRILGTILHRCRLFETEASLYFFFDVHHVVFDGTSFKVFLRDVMRAYRGEALDRDYYCLLLARRAAASETPFYQESGRYFEREYGEWFRSYRPKVDFDTGENAVANVYGRLGLDSATLAAAERRYGVSRNVFVLAAFARALACQEQTDRVFFSWVYNGREDVESESTCGLLFRSLPIAFDLSGFRTAGELLARAEQQVAAAIEHACYPFFALNSRVYCDDIAEVLYQNDIADAALLAGLDGEKVEVRQNQDASQSVLDFNVLDGHDGLRLDLHYAASRYRRETMETLRDRFAAACRELAS